MQASSPSCRVSQSSNTVKAVCTAQRIVELMNVLRKAKGPEQPPGGSQRPFGSHRAHPSFNEFSCGIGHDGAYLPSSLSLLVI